MNKRLARRLKQAGVTIGSLPEKARRGLDWWASVYGPDVIARAIHKSLKRYRPVGDFDWWEPTL